VAVCSHIQTRTIRAIDGAFGQPRKHRATSSEQRSRALEMGSDDVMGVVRIELAWNGNQCWGRVGAVKQLRLL
jgi:hypothetical protein